MIMLSPQLQSILDNRLRYLPEITKSAIMSIDWPTKIISIGHHYGLHVDDMEEFQGVVLKSMLGMIAPEQFESALMTTLALSPANIERIITDLNNQVFEPIHDYVLAGGKTDALKNAGLEIAPATPDPVSIPTTPSPSVTSEDILEIPASPQPIGKFEDFF